VLLASSAPVVVVHVVSSGPNWLVLALTLLGSFLAGTATALLIQLYVVPGAETRKRKAQRWEEDVRELSDVVALQLSDTAGDARAAQALYFAERGMIGYIYRPEAARDAAKESRDSSLAFGSLIYTHVDRLMGRVLQFNPDHDEIKRLTLLNHDYRMKAILVRLLPDRDDPTYEQFTKEWDKERKAREALIKQVQVLEGMSPPSPPRKLSWR
jgi:hypothetical protein